MIRNESNQGQSAAQGDPAQGAAATRADGPWTVRRLLVWITSFLEERSVDAPRRTAEILVSEVLGVERLRLYMEPDRELEAGELAALRALVARSGRHEPVQFLVGKWPFLGRDFKVAPCTLIPRPCTETLVEHALAWYRERGAGRAEVLDLCTGTGCIAVSLALGMRAIARPPSAGCKPLRGADPAPALPTIDRSAPSGDPVDRRAVESFDGDVRVTASDIVAEAVVLARENATRLGARIDFRTGDLWSVIRADERFDLVVSNPPYVTDAEYAELDRNVRDYEPASALCGGRDGLDFVRRVVQGARAHLRPGGLLLVEVGWKHREQALALVSDSAWRGATVIKDGEGIDRVLAVHRAG
jgi:release factor glutamine methyltransferase